MENEEIFEDAFAVVFIVMGERRLEAGENDEANDGFVDKAAVVGSICFS
jgi:hypothetical protein